MLTGLMRPRNSVFLGQNTKLESYSLMCMEVYAVTGTVLSTYPPCYLRMAVEQGSPTFLKLRATSRVLSHTKGYQFDTLF